MKNLRLLVLAILILASQFAIAKAPVWKISKGDDYLYLGGTIHVLSANDYPLPKAFDTAFTDADAVYFEVDIQAMNSPQAQMKLLPIITFTDGRTLKSELDESVYAELQSYLEDRQIPIAGMQQLTPAGVSLTLTMLELQRLGIADANGVDNHYSLRSINEDKQRGALESIDEQLEFMRSMNNVDGNKIIKSTLRDLGTLEENWKSLLSAWRTGDLTAMEKLGIEPMQEFPTMFNLLLVQRNNNWIKKILPMLQTEEIELLLVGSLHMAGDDGLLHQLKQHGYQIEQLD